MSNTYYVRFRGRVRGPFDEEKLVTMVHRGQLSRMHEVSTDGATWDQAGAFPQLFISRQPRKNTATPDESTTADPHVPATEQPRTQSGDYWYCGANGERIGPVSWDALRLQVETGRLLPHHLVWTNSLPEWVSADSITGLIPPRNAKSRPLARRSAKRGLFWVLSACVLILLICSALLLVGKWPSSAGLQLTFPSPNQSVKKFITSWNDPAIESAVLFVAVGVELTSTTGETRQLCIGCGSSFAVTSDGLLITNCHVIEQFQKFKKAPTQLEQIRVKGGWERVVPKIWVFLNNRQVEASVKFISSNPNFDFAVIKIDPPRPMPYFAVSATNQPSKQSEVVALGYPGAQFTPFSEQEFEQANLPSSILPSSLESIFPNMFGTVNHTRGVVTNLQEKAGFPWIVHQAAISPGNSGGPLINRDGVVIGINTQLINANVAQGMFYALWTGAVKEVMDDEFPGLVAWK